MQPEIPSSAARVHAESIGAAMNCIEVLCVRFLTHDTLLPRLDVAERLKSSYATCSGLKSMITDLAAGIRVWSWDPKILRPIPCSRTTTP
jgi:hypothetical protein